MNASSLMTPEVNLCLTSIVLEGDPFALSAIYIDAWQGEIGVWLPITRRFDPPTGKGDSVFEALADAVYNSLKEKRKHV